MTNRLHLVLGAPGGAEMPLLAELAARDDIYIEAVIDPDGQSLGAAVAEIMGLPIVAKLSDLTFDDSCERRLLIPRGPGRLAAALSREAEQAGLATLRPDELRAELAAVAGAAAREGQPVADPDATLVVERESATLQASFAEFADALAGDVFLRRLVTLCARAVGASGGSVMLLDDASRELTIAYATGLSEGTQHATRVALGEGIAGRVAVTLEAELVEGKHGIEAQHRDRPDITTAICAPLVADDRLLGVLNVSTQAGEPPLDRGALARIERLGAQFARVLADVQRMQDQRTGRMFHLTERRLRQLAEDYPKLPDLLSAWAAALAVTTEADFVSIAVPCEDGRLFVAAGDAKGQRENRDEPLHDPVWLDVLGSGLPQVARETTADDSDGEPVTVFYLPVGRDPVRAGVAVQFGGTKRAYEFHGLAGETAFLLERLLPDLLDRHRHAQRADRLARMSTVVAEVTSSDAPLGTSIQELCETLRALTGAEYAIAVADITDNQPRLAGGNAPEDATWLGDAARLLNDAVDDGWRITTVETAIEAVSVLAVGNPAGAATPGFFLVGKQRTHLLDGQVFTPLDAEIVLPLAGLLTRLIPRAGDNGVPSLAAMLPPAEIAEAASGEVSGGDPRGEDRLLADLAREMDRCDRYHNACGLVLIRPDLVTTPVLDLLIAAARRLATSLRASDRIYALPSGELALLVPEDVRHLDLLTTRLQATLRELSGIPDLVIANARGAYPTDRGPAEAFVAVVRQRLRP